MRRAAWLVGIAFAGAAAMWPALPAAADEPGDLIIARTITPRIAYDVVPNKDDPVTVRVTTFPKSTFDGVMGGLVSDLDLNGARGSEGVANRVGPSALAAATAALGVGSAGQQRNGAPMGLSGMGGTNTIGTTVSQTITRRACATDLRPRESQMIRDELLRHLRHLRSSVRSIALMCAVLSSTATFAQSLIFVMPEKQALLLNDVRSVVGTDAANGVVGTLAVNLAAGVDNVQSNQAAVLHGSGAATVSGHPRVRRVQESVPRRCRSTAMRSRTASA
jgi:hypothetical protein